MNIVAIIQARTNSKRLPGKVLKPLADTSVIGFLYNRVTKITLIDKIVFAIPDTDVDDVLNDLLEELGCKIYRGSENDVLARYYAAAKEHAADAIVRITGDCPLIDPIIADDIIKSFVESDADYASNINPPTFADGMDVEVFSFRALNDAFLNASTTEEREHVTPYIRNHKKFKKVNIISNEDSSQYRLTLDNQKDYEAIQLICDSFYDDNAFSLADILKLVSSNERGFKKQFVSLDRNQGAKLSSGQKLWHRASEIIPGGNMLLSKRPDMFSPDHWPTYFSRAKGCQVWDVDDREYTDFSLMGVGTNILGYGCDPVDHAVINAVGRGNLSTLNAPEEVYLAERLIEMHPFAEMVRFCRTGGEANAVAIRIARAATGKDTVAICGYHGWHDWYLATNIQNSDGLEKHLLPGLSPLGVPKGLAGSVIPFEYNKIEQLEKILKSQKVAAIKMEVVRNAEPADDFLQKVRQLASKHDAVLIFDECTTGFRESFGGIHKKFNIDPDLAVFGKTLGNGYAITAIIGRHSIMDAAQNTFVSSTFWTERIGSTAALAALDVMEKEKSWEHVTKIGKLVTEGWISLAEMNNLDVVTFGIPALTNFTFQHSDALKFKTFLTQEMLKKHYLATTTFYPSLAHNENLVTEYFEKLEPIFTKIKSCQDGNANIDELLDGQVCTTGFKRLN